MRMDYVSVRTVLSDDPTHKQKGNGMKKAVITGCSSTFVCMLSILSGQVSAEQITVGSPDQTATYTIDLDNMQIMHQAKDGKQTELSSPNATWGKYHSLATNIPNQKKWVYQSPATTVTAITDNDNLKITFASNPTGNDSIDIPFPIITEQSNDKAWTLPIFEGIYVNKHATQWRDKLSRIEGESLTEKLSMPAIGILGQNAMRIVIFEDQYSNYIESSQDTQGNLQFSIAHRFNRLQKNKSYSVLFKIQNNDLLGVAKAYRQYVIETDQFVSLSDKFEYAPQGKRMIGAIQGYLWGDKLVYGDDLNSKQCKAFAKRLIAASENKKDSAATWWWGNMTEEQQKQVREVAAEEWVSMYTKNNFSLIIDQFAQNIEVQNTPVFQSFTDPNVKLSTETPIHKVVEANMAVFQQAYGNLFTNYKQWGSGISTRMINQIKAAGINKAHLSTGGLTSTSVKPWVAEAATQAGYLMGPYDSYHSVHRPDMVSDNTWETAQFDWDAYNDGAIIRKNGQPIHGFKKIGRKLSPLIAMPYVKKRVNKVTSEVPFTSWFVDCDAFGEVYDDWNPRHEASQEDGANARLGRMQWLAQSKHLVVGSEGGSAYASPVISFAHGMMSPVIGWGDPLHKDRSSKYYLGAWYPENAPGIFFKPVPLQEKYIDLYYNPTVRLPLYQAALHDSVITTHHWGNGTLKYNNTDNTTMLLEILYNVPPMFHFSPTAFRKQKSIIAKHAEVFDKLHTQTWNKPLISFEFLSDNELLQQTRFEGGTTVIANFDSIAHTINDLTIEPRSIAYKLTNQSDFVTYKP
ncbi:hypothetical protein JD969_04645 [Planctomycetota bacterium]|nr:hypothetical protein JD969_04645 [Planctomycetota bacterium]